MFALILLFLAVLLPGCSGSEVTTTRISAEAQDESSDVDVTLSDGQHLRVRVLGESDGAPLLLLTGGPGFAGDQLLPLAERLRDRHQVVLPDQRGTGASPQVEFDPSVFTIEQAVQDLEEMRRVLGVEEFVLVGHSWGGILSMAYAAEHPERARALALICPGGIDKDFWQAYNTNLFARLDEEQQRAMQALRPADASREAAEHVAREMNALLASVTVLNQDAVPALQANLRDPARFAPGVGQAMGPSLFAFDLKPALAEYAGEVLVLQGEGDPIGRPTAQQIVDTIPRARLQVLTGVGHWPFLEDMDSLVLALDVFLQNTTKTAG